MLDNNLLRSHMFVFVVPVALAVGCSAPPARTIHLEAEDAQLHGPAVATTRAGFSGTGYVTGFTKPDCRIEWQVSAKAGLYEAKVRYSSPGQQKGFVLVVNGSKTNGMFQPTDEGFATASAGKIELKNGQNAVAVEQGWGWYEVDYLELVPAAPSKQPQKPPAVLADPKATPGAKALYAFLVGRYGSRTLTGQNELPDSEYILKTTGKTPAVLGGDLIEYSPSRREHGSDPKDAVEKIIDAARTGRVVAMCWHWNAPTGLIDKELTGPGGNKIDARWYKGFMAEATTFDFAKALENKESADYRLLLRDIDAIAVQIKKFADAGVPVLWRPLHEAEGAWFWWGTKGPQAYIKLWRLMFDRMTKTHGLHNLIWVHNCLSPDWYPGDAYVDVVGADAYPDDHSDPLSATWDGLMKWLDGRKPVALTEFGGVPDLSKMARFGVRWSYFMSWNGTPLSQSADSVKRSYGSPEALNGDQLPKGWH